MKTISLMTISALLTCSLVPLAIQADDTPSRFGIATKYKSVVLRDKTSGAVGTVGEWGYQAGQKISDKAESAWGTVLDTTEGIQKNHAISNGDAVAINALAYSLILRDEERKNTDLKDMKKEREDRAHQREKLAKESERLNKYAKEYRDIAKDAQKNLSDNLSDLEKATANLKSLDADKKERLNKLLEDHKKLGNLTGKDGDPRIGSQLLVSMKENLVVLESAIKSSPDSASSEIIKARIASIGKTIQKSQKRFDEKQSQIQDATAKINQLESFDEKGALTQEENTKRAMVLASLNTSVSNLVTSGEFSKARSQLAFAHFDELEKEMEGKGVKAGDMKAAYQANIDDITKYYNETPVGLYVNNQIVKALGSICDIVNNRCADSEKGDLFKFLDDSSRKNYKKNSSLFPDASGKDPGAQIFDIKN